MEIPTFPGGLGCPLGVGVVTGLTDQGGGSLDTWVTFGRTCKVQLGQVSAEGAGIRSGQQAEGGHGGAQPVLLSLEGEGLSLPVRALMPAFCRFLGQSSVPFRMPGPGTLAGEHPAAPSMLPGCRLPGRHLNGNQSITQTQHRCWSEGWVWLFDCYVKQQTHKYTG